MDGASSAGDSDSYPMVGIVSGTLASKGSTMSTSLPSACDSIQVLGLLASPGIASGSLAHALSPDCRSALLAAPLTAPLAFGIDDLSSYTAGVLLGDTVGKAQGTIVSSSEEIKTNLETLSSAIRSEQLLSPAYLGRVMLRPRSLASIASGDDEPLDGAMPSAVRRFSVGPSDALIARQAALAGGGALHWSAILDPRGPMLSTAQVDSSTLSTSVADAESLRSVMDAGVTTAHLEGMSDAILGKASMAVTGTAMLLRLPSGVQAGRMDVVVSSEGMNGAHASHLKGALAGMMTQGTLNATWDQMTDGGSFVRVWPPRLSEAEAGVADTMLFNASRSSSLGIRRARAMLEAVKVDG